MSKFINPFTDMGFKRIFGQELSKPLLIDFLNNLLTGERHIVDVQFLDKEQVGRFDEDRSPIYDFYCLTDSGEHIIVEMQNREQPHFRERTLYYSAEAIVRQGERGTMWNYDLKAVYLVAFTNFSFGELPGNFRIDVGLTDLSNGELFCDKLRLIYLQLPLFNKEADDCSNDFERWIYVLKNMETLNRLPWAAKDSVFQRLAEIAEVSALTKEERVKYDYALKRFRDTLNAMAGARMEGLAEGMEKGMEKGMAEGMEKGMAEGMEKGMAEGMEKGRKSQAVETAKLMKEKGYNVADIAELTGLQPEAIEEL